MATTFTERGAELRLAQDMAAGRITAQQFQAGYRGLTKATRGARKKFVSESNLGYATSASPIRPPAAPVEGMGTIAAQSASPRLAGLKKQRSDIYKRMRANADKLRQMSSLYGGM